MLRILLAGLTLATATLFGQPTAVSDNPGEASTFNDFFQSDDVGYINGTPVFLAIDPATGEEPHALIDGVLTLLSDVAPGADGIRVGEYLEAFGRLYFNARFNSGDPGQLWSTDGTPEGTLLEYTSPGANVGPLTQDAEGNIYFSTNGGLYRFDGTEAELVAPGISYFPASDRANVIGALTPYRDGLAGVLKNGNRQFDLIYLRDSVEVLASVDTQGETTTFAGGLTIQAVTGGLVFSVGGNFQDFKSNFVYDEVGDSLRALDLPIFDYQYIINDSLRLFVADMGGTTFDEDIYFRFDDVNVAPERVLDGVALNSVREFPNLSTDGTALYWQANYGAGGNYDLHVTDGTAAGTRVFATGSFRESGFSNVLAAGRYRIYVGGIGESSFNRTTFRVFDTTTGEGTVAFQSEEGVGANNSLVLLDVVDDRLYFVWELRAGGGRELFSLELPVNPTSTDPNVNRVDLDVTITTDHFTVNSDRPEPVTVTILGVDGRQLGQLRTTTNTATALADVRGAAIYVFELPGRFGVRQIVRFR